MTYLILFMVMDEKSIKVQIVHPITDVFSPAGTIYSNIEGQAIGFCGDFIGDKLPTMVQVTDTNFKNIKVKAPPLIFINQAMDADVLTNQTLLLHDDPMNEETVPTLFPFPGAYIEILMGNHSWQPTFLI